MILLHSELKKELKNKNLIFSDDNPKIGPNSIDVKLGKFLKTYVECKIIDLKIKDKNYKAIVATETAILDMKQKNKTFTYEIPEEGLVLTPGILYLGYTIEKAGSTKYVPMYEGRSSLARLGLQSHLSAGFGDIGFKENWTLEIVVVHPLIIYPNIRIGQVYFLAGKGKIENLYNGKYNKNNKAKESESFKDFK